MKKSSNGCPGNTLDICEGVAEKPLLFYLTENEILCIL